MRWAMERGIADFEDLGSGVITYRRGGGSETALHSAKFLSWEPGHRSEFASDKNRRQTLVNDPAVSYTENWCYFDLELELNPVSAHRPWNPAFRGSAYFSWRFKAHLTVARRVFPGAGVRKRAKEVRAKHA
jgi:hypothetical protein